MKVNISILSIFFLVSCVRSHVSAYVAHPVAVYEPSIQISLTVSGKITTEFGTPKDVTVTLSNTGEGVVKDIKFSDVVAPWKQKSTTCSTSLESTKSCIAVYTFTPTSIANSTTTLTVSSNASSESVTLEGTSTTATVTVSPIYPKNGANWNDYVINNNGGTDRYSQPDTACVGTEQFYDGCIHGGEKRVVTLTSESSCDGLSFVESLGMFNWICKVVNGKVNFYSVSLKDEKKLGDLIDASAVDWKLNSVTISKSNIVYYKSSSAKWWTNAVKALPDSSSAVAVLSDASTIYFSTSNMNSLGYNINADKIGFVTLNDTHIKMSASTNNCATSTGKATSPTASCVLASGSQKFLWIEGTLDGARNNAAYVLFLLSISHSKLRHLNLTSAILTNFQMSTSDNNLLYKLKSTYSGLYGIAFTGSRNIFSEVSSFGEGYPISDYGSDQVFTKVIIASAAADGFTSTYALSSNVFGVGFTVVNTAGNAVYLNGTNKKFSSVAAVNNSGSGLLLTNGSNLSFAQVFSAANGGVGVNASSITNGYFTENLVVSSNAGQCNIVAGTNPGLVTTTCANQGTSNATLSTTAGLATSAFVGKVTTDDVKNPSDTNGLVAYSLSLNFWLFDNFFRGFGRDGSTFPNSDNINYCNASCRIWDFRNASSDTGVRGKTGASMASVAFVKGTTCPASVHGNKSWIGFNSAYYLYNAVEVFEDDIGNDNGLCESGEACIFQPNYGAYLGEGDWKNNGTCTFQDGNVTGVTMYGYPTNGG